MVKFLNFFNLINIEITIFPDFVDNFPEFSPISLLCFPILCKLDNLTL